MQANTEYVRAINEERDAYLGMHIWGHLGDEASTFPALDLR